MNEVSSTRNSRGLFRTPLACALLTGVLSVGACETIRPLLWKLPKRFYIDHEYLGLLIHYGIEGLLFAVQISGAAICRRSARIAWRTILAGILINLALRTFSIGYYQFYNPIMNSASIHNLIRFTLRSVLIGVCLAGLYNFRHKSVSALLAVLASAPLQIFYFMGLNGSAWFLSLGQSSDREAFLWLFENLTLIAIIVLPALPIDRAFRSRSENDL